MCFWFPQVSLVAALLGSVCLVIYQLLLPFFVHAQDLVLPFRVVARDTDTDIGDDGGVSGGDSLVYGTYWCASVGLIRPLIGQLGLPLQLPEVDMHWFIPHAQFSHSLLVDLLNGRVPELFMEQFSEFVPRGVPISGPPFIVIRWYIPIFFLEMYPPVLGSPFKMQGGEYHHERGDPYEVLLECLEVGFAVSKEPIDIVVLPFEGSRVLHQDQFDPGQGWR